VCDLIDPETIKDFTSRLKTLRGRCFIVGIGGSAANCSHLVNDLRKIGGIDASSPLDNVAELTARINDDSWATCLSETLKVSNINEDDCLIVLSVGGGSNETSANLVHAIKEARDSGSQVLSIVSRDGGYALKNSDVCVLIPVVNDSRITPHAEEFQGVVWHLIVNFLGVS
tara:strand:+ start:8165 stop:8677 length:513 start_codon:yes stop_codon:yes gene_type:complete